MRRAIYGVASGAIIVGCVAAMVMLGCPGLSGAKTPAAPAAVTPLEKTQKAPGQISGMDALTCIFTRRSIRKYTDQPVSDATVRTLLEAAMAAPSARNEQPWEFIVIRDKKILRQVPEFHPFAKHIPEAPAAIVVCGNTKLEAHKGLWALDCSNAAMNMLLAAHSMGLGAVWTTLYPYEERMAGMKKLLQIPEHIIPLVIVPVGYPAEKKEPAKDRFNPARIHNDRW